MNARYRFDDQAIVYEIIQNEVVLVNLESGYYYILDDIASVIWLALKEGSTVDAVVRSLMATYHAPPGVIQSSVEELAAELVLENIFRLESETAPDTAEPSSDMPLPVPGPKTFFKPNMSKFTDMKYVIPMDPIWDFDETGWPRRRPNPPSNKK